MANQEVGGLAGRLFQCVQGRVQVLAIGIQRAVAKAALGVAQAGEVETQRGDALFRQGARQAHGRGEVLGTGEAVCDAGLAQQRTVIRFDQDAVQAYAAGGVDRQAGVADGHGRGMVRAGWVCDDTRAGSIS